MVSKHYSFIRLFPIFLGIMALLSTACLPKTQNNYLNDDKQYVQDQDEEVREPYIPTDDGMPMSQQELLAFSSRGQLDAKMTQSQHELVEPHFKAFVHRNRATFERFLARSARYLPYAKQVFAEKGLPEEMAYLFIIESGGNPNAYSSAKATGLWQFMSFTGKKYGLEQNNWHDERRDPFKATHAAADYLLKLYADFGDWHLAAAAYNAGEGKIGRALERTGATNFFELCERNDTLDNKAQLRKETLSYVPSLIAVAKIMRNLDTLGFTPPTADEAYNLEAVNIPPGTSLTGLARNANLTWDEFAAMNPAFRRTASHPTMHTVAYLPPQMVPGANSWLESPDARIYAGWKEYTVKRGDTFNTLAKRHRTSVAAIQQANSITKMPKPGTTLLIPGGSTQVEPVLAAGSSSGQNLARIGKYTVQSGDSVYALAQIWGTSQQSIMELNKLSSHSLKVGQVLSIPSDSTQYKTTPKSGIHIVQRGDTLGAIAVTYGVSVKEIMQANRLTENSKLNIGQKLRIGKPVQSTPTTIASTKPSNNLKPVVSDRPSSRQSAGTSHTIKQGDTLSQLAARHGVSVGDIMRANNLDNKSKLKVGQVLTIPGGNAKPASPSAASAPMVVSIQKGDTLYSIARQHNTSVDKLLAANKLPANTTLKLGQRIIIP